jgi:hypothetical protein
MKKKRIPAECLKYALLLHCLILKPCLACADDLWKQAEAIEQSAQQQGIKAQFTARGELAVQYPPGTIKDTIGLAALVDENRLALTCEARNQGWRICRVQIPAPDPKIEMVKKAAIITGSVLLGIIIPGGGLVEGLILQEGYSGAATLVLGSDERSTFPSASEKL